MKVRRVKFDFKSGMPVHYLRENLFSTHFVNSLHVIFPEGERFFIRSLQKVVPGISDNDLLQQIRDFSGQEGAHAHQHMLFWKVLSQQGFSIDAYARFYRKFCYNGVEQLIYKIYGEEYGAKVCVAVTAALEHYTSMLAEVVFEYQDNWTELPEEMKHLLYWHAAEEIEHKSVAYNVLKHLDNSYILRATGMFIATTLLWGFAMAGMGMFIWQDKEKNILKMPADAWDFAKTIGHPAFRKFVQQWYKFFDKDFHPDQIDNWAYAESYFAAQAERYSARRA
jgi:predicted metal-dependent hydrolase